MHCKFEDVAERHMAAVARVFAADPSVRAVGIGMDRPGGGYVFRVVRNRSVATAYASVTEFEDIPVTYIDVDHDPESFANLPPSTTGGGRIVPEQQRHNPLCSGVEIQNWDQNWRDGYLSDGVTMVGSLGCFVELSAGNIALVSNNHVIGGHNRGQIDTDRIVQPGSLRFQGHDHVATLHAICNLEPSRQPAAPAPGAPDWNYIDAAIATLEDGRRFEQAFLPGHHRPRFSGTMAPQLLDTVYLAGRTSSLSIGTVEAINTVVSMGYAHPTRGPFHVWFQGVFVIRSNGSLPIAAQGDSGAAVVTSTGVVVGLLVGGHDMLAYACPIDTVLSHFNCRLAP